MSDIFKDMQTNIGCEYISDLPSYKRKVWQEMKRLNPADYEERQLEDFSKYMFGIRNVFPLSGRITNIYLSEDKCYYLLENDRNVGISVYSVDLNSFKNELVYSSGGDNTEDFYGLADKESSDASEILENIATVKWFFVIDKYVYYQKESVIYKCPITGRKQYVIDENVSEGEIRYSNGILYYKDAYGEQENYDEHAD